MRRPLPPKALTLGQRRAAAATAIVEAERHGAPFDPVRAGGPVAAAWGRAWLEHLEREPAWAGLLERGRLTPREGLVIDLRARPGRIDARVQCHLLYTVFIELPVVTEDELRALVGAVAGELTTVAALQAGQLSDRAAAALRAPRGALLPDPAALRHGCTCGDHEPSTLCRHVAAALYAVGHRHDREPDLLFTLRGVDPGALVAAGARPAAAPARRPPPPAPPPPAPPPPAPAPPRPPLPALADDDHARAVAAVRARVDGLRAVAAKRPLSGEEAHMLRVFEPWLRARGG